MKCIFDSTKSKAPSLMLKNNKIDSWKMLAFMVLSLLVCSCLGDKEYSEDFASFLNDELIHELEKRLMDYDNINHESRPNSQCTFASETDLIIKTKVSLDQGAIFIDSPVFDDDEADPRLACQERCCQTEDCNLAVFKEKGEHACYLFNCGEPSKCNFSTHEGFTSIGLTGGIKHDQMISASKNQHAQDLADLAAKTTTTSTTSTSTTPVPTKPPKKQPVPLFGTCEEDKDCAGSGTECLASYCVCADGYHPQDGICRESCTRFQFKCKNDGQPLLNPQCVAIYDTCDGVKHCQDGSDEQNCSPGTKGFKGDGRKPPQNTGNPAPNRPNWGASVGGSTIGERPNSGTEPEKPVPTSVDNNVQAQTIEKNTKQEQKTQTQDSTSVEVNQNEVPEEPKTGDGSHKNDDQEKDIKVLSNENSSKDISEDKPSSDNDNLGDRPKKPDISVAKVEVGGDADLSVEESPIVERVASNKFSNKTAVVVLAMGLGITAILLMFVGCRLRNVKRRLRKGRPMNSNEADYLINGMYL